MLLIILTIGMVLCMSGVSWGYLRLLSRFKVLSDFSDSTRTRVHRLEAATADEVAAEPSGMELMAKFSRLALTEEKTRPIVEKTYGCTLTLRRDGHGALKHQLYNLPKIEFDMLRETVSGVDKGRKAMNP